MRARAICPPGSWTIAVATVLIDYDGRHRRRFMLRTTDGRDLLLDLPHAVHMRNGSGLVLDDGGIVEVRARPEALLEIETSEPDALVRIAWHLGNRHLPMQIAGAHLLIRDDHVIAAMIAGLGGHARAVLAPFDPEAGAYAGGHEH